MALSQFWLWLWPKWSILVHNGQKCFKCSKKHVFTKDTLFTKTHVLPKTCWEPVFTRKTCFHKKNMFSPKISSKMVQNGLNWSKMVCNGPKWSKWSKSVQYGPKWSKIVQTGPNWSNKVQKCKKIFFFLNYPKCSEKCSNVVQNSPNRSKQI